MMKIFSHIYAKTGESGQVFHWPASGQALVELSVFGAFFLLLLGALLSYGLKYNYQQKAQMTAFRRALKIASDQERGSGSVMIMESKSVPDPMSLFGVGSSQTITASANVQRDYQMHAQVVDADSLAGSVMDIQTKRDEAAGTQEWMRRMYKTAGFRVEYSVPKSNLGKYEIVYGSIRARNGGSWVNPSDKNADITSDAYDAIRIIDGCSGEIVDFDSCYDQSRMLVDRDYCTRKCDIAKVPGSKTNCSAECGKLTNAPNQSSVNFDSSLGGAWYAADWHKDAKGKYVFPHLNAMFGFAASNVIKSMGMQSNFSQNNIRDESMQRIETPAQITTQESMTWADISYKTLVHREGLTSAAYEKPFTTPSDAITSYPAQGDDVTIEVSGSSSQTTTTGK